MIGLNFLTTLLFGCSSGDTLACNKDNVGLKALKNSTATEDVYIECVDTEITHISAKWGDLSTSHHYSWETKSYPKQQPKESGVIKEEEKR